MQQLKTSVFFLGASLFLLVTFPSQAAEMSIYYPGSHRELAWTASAEGQLHGLSLTTQSRARPQVVTQLLLVDEHERLIVSSSLDRLAAIERLRLTDDRTGWWMELETHYGISGVEGEEYPQFFARLYEWLEGENNHNQIQVRTRAGLHWTLRVQVPGLRKTDTSDLVGSLRDQGGLEELLESTPNTLLGSAELWYEALKPIGLGTKLFELLVMLDESVDHPSVKLISDIRFRPGTKPDGLPWQELIHTFDHFDPENPFPEDLFAPR